MALIDIAIEGLRAKSIANSRAVPSPSLSQLSEAESQLSIKFPPSFVAFLSQAGSFALSYWETYWVGDKSLASRNIVEANLNERRGASSGLPSYLVAFHNNGCGDQLCFDTRIIDLDGEYPIVFWDHELTPEENLRKLFPVAENFAAWLMEEVENHVA